MIAPEKMGYSISLAFSAIALSMSSSSVSGELTTQSSKAGIVSGGPSKCLRREEELSLGVLLLEKGDFPCSN